MTRTLTERTRMKTIIGTYTNPHGHWVGNGFPVRSLFAYQNLGQELSPFLLLDRAGPYAFEPSENRRGVGTHPHRGFETVTLVYQGEVSHADSTGQGGTIGPGDVQWMTASAGILHEEFHSDAFTRQGGTLDMVQLWVNLPAVHKMTPPRYQAITAQAIPTVALPGGGALRVIAGEYAGADSRETTDTAGPAGAVTGPAQTVSPLQVWDMQLPAKAECELPAAEGWNMAVVVLHGSVQVNHTQPATEGELVVLSTSGQNAWLQATTDAMVLVLQGQPLNEPIVGHGPFVMNTRAEISQAIADFNQGQFGNM